MVHPAAGVERLGIPAYNWWNECLHGVARAGVRPPSFPRPSGWPATCGNPRCCAGWLRRSPTKHRAKHHDHLRHSVREYLHRPDLCRSPNVTFSVTRVGGVAQETYGEDPSPLRLRLGVTSATGLQGDDPQYLKLVATPKHYAVHSGPSRTPA